MGQNRPVPRAAAIYCRISDDRDGSAAGVRRQEADCQALAERRGWPVAEVFVDNDASAYSGRARPAYRRMLEALKDGSIDAVVVWHLDRLHRRPAELEEFFEICDAAGVKDLASVTGDVDLSTHDGRFMARILGAVARKESDDKSRRTRRKHLELAEQGVPVGGRRPYGYEADKVTICPAEAEMLREAAARVLAGESIRGICLDWADRGLPSPSGGRWRPTTLRRILLAHRVAGRRSLGKDGPVMAEGAWPAIIDPATHDRLRAVLLDRARGGGFPARRYLLSGFLVCGRCGTRLIANPRTNRGRSYACSSGPMRGGCGGVRIIAAQLEDLVVDLALARVDDAAFAEVLADEVAGFDEDAVMAEITAAEAKLAELARMWAASEITRGEWVAARADLERLAAAARRRLVRTTEVRTHAAWAGQGDQLRAAWEEMSLEVRRSILASLVESVRIDPVRERGWNRFDPERVAVQWVGGR